MFHCEVGLYTAILMLYMVIYGYICLYMVIYGYIWLYMVIYGYIWLYMVIYGYIRLYMVIYTNQYGYIWHSTRVLTHLSRCAMNLKLNLQLYIA